MRAAMGAEDVGVVVIGRNEGERLRTCLRSVGAAGPRVYVDSGSTDDSRALARSFGVDVVELSRPPDFTAARGRNAGIARLLATRPDLPFVQVIDGDCELDAGWIDLALHDMTADLRRAVVFGRRRERRPLANAYHAATDHEWAVPLGEVESCGGDALLRVAALQEVGGYDDALIAGEEPDLCLRLRQRGWLIWSNGGEMTLHDIAMDRFGQWWRRAQRAGFAFTQLVRLHGAAANAHWRRLVRSALGWAAVIVGAAALLVAALATRRPLFVAPALLLWALLAVQFGRLMAQQRRIGATPRRAAAWAWLLLAAKPAQALGWLQFQRQRLTRRRAALIEYKK